MKLIKMIGLAAIAALAAMAFVGASSASATYSTQLCATDSAGATCPNPVTHVHDVDPAVLWLNTTTGYVECIGLFLTDAGGVGALGSPQILIGRFSFSSCEDEAGRFCTVTEPASAAPAAINLLKLAGETALVTFEYEVLVRCGIFIHCVYNGQGLDGIAEGALLVGGTGLSSTHSAVLNKVAGVNCPRQTELDALYAPLSATYIRE